MTPDVPVQDEPLQYDIAKRINIIAGDLVTWEAVYDNGFVLMERVGFKYKDINRDRLVSFKLVEPGGVLFECWPPDGATGHNLIYRRRTLNTGGTRVSVVFLIGWAPMGPAHLIDPLKGHVRTEAGFIPNDEDMYPPSLIAEEDGRYLADLYQRLYGTKSDELVPGS